MNYRERKLRQLSLVDWDFPSSVSGLSSTIHWYPGTFPAQLPTTLIEAISEEDDLVVDPYGGIGTTCVEALRLGRRAWQVDINPVANLAAYVHGCLVLLKAASPERLPILFQIAGQRFGTTTSHTQGALLPTPNDSSLKLDGVLDGLVRPRPCEFLEQLRALGTPNWQNLSKWVESVTLAEIREVTELLDQGTLSDFEQLFHLLILSSILKGISSQTRSWGHIADNVHPRVMVRKRLCLQAGRQASWIQNGLAALQVSPLRGEGLNTCRLWVSQHDWSGTDPISPAPNAKARLLITSPPYGGAIDYTLSQRLSFYLLGYSDQHIGRLWHAEIGARRKRFVSTSRTDWAMELGASLEKQVSIVREDGEVVYVMPHKEAGRENGSAIVREIMEKLGWLRIFATERSIRQLRARQSWTSIKRETVELFSRSIQL